jgi:2-dehydro-3-deoxyphosphogluconate aldolase / (4S)-4-hydroxy-2-oxoglutarate aldolase
MSHPMNRRLARAVVVPVVRMHDERHAETAVKVLSDSGIEAFEMTMTTPGALRLIERLRANGGALIGAGTVTTPEEAAACIAAGAEFVVSPVVLPDVARACAERAVPCYLGAATPTEVLAAHRAGAAAVKIFPAAQLGGPAYLRAIRSVFPEIALMPTGGIGVENIAAYMAAGALCVGMGGKLVDEGAIAEGRLGDVAEAAGALLSHVSELRGAA